MKKNLSIAASLFLAVQCFATGDVPSNTPQSGVINWTTASTYAGGFVVSNTFAPAFTIPPLVVLTPLNTNNYTAFVLSNVTATTFAVIATNNSTINTNFSCAWQAYLPSPVIQNGSIIVNTAFTTNVSFTTPYAAAPNVFLTGSAAGTNDVVSAITATNFTIVGTISNTVQWLSIGSTYAPNVQTVTH